jgi:ABC-type transport system involved in cytochrome c biogenesis ATPase subunit
MFQQFYGFSRLPFSKDIPPQDLFQAEGQQELCARLSYLVKERGLGLVTGETGSGKSTALRRFVASLDANRHFVIYLSNPLLGMSGLYREILTALGHEPLFSRPKMVAKIRSVFEDLIQNKHRIPVVILDEAHALPDTAFDPFRLLFSTQMDSQSLGTLLLVGHPELRRTGFSFDTSGKLLMIAAPGYLLVGVINELFRGANVLPTKTNLIVAGSLLASGAIFTTFQVRKYRIGKKFTLKIVQSDPSLNR